MNVEVDNGYMFSIKNNSDFYAYKNMANKDTSIPVCDRNVHFKQTKLSTWLTLIIF